MLHGVGSLELDEAIEVEGSLKRLELVGLICVGQHVSLKADFVPHDQSTAVLGPVNNVSDVGVVRDCVELLEEVGDADQEPGHPLRSLRAVFV